MKTKRWVAALLCVLLIGSLFPASAFATDEPEENAVFVESAEGIVASDNIRETEPEPQTDETASVQDTFEEESIGSSSENTETEEQTSDAVEIIPDENEPSIEQNDAPAEPGGDDFPVSPATPSDAMQETEADISPAAAFGAVPGGVPGVPAAGYSLTLDENWEGGMGQVISNITSYVLPSVTRPGETFYGWSTVRNGPVRYRAGDTVMLSADMTLYAVWTSITQQTFSISVQPVVGGSAFCDKSFAAAGETVTLTAMPDVGYSFEGWQVISPNGLTITDNKFIMPDSDVTVKAEFFIGKITESPYRVHIHPGEGSGTVFTITNETTLLWQLYQNGFYDAAKDTFFKNESGEVLYEFPKQCPFTAPEGKVFDCWQATSAREGILGHYSGGYIVDLNVFPQDYTGGRTINLTALWKDAGADSSVTLSIPAEIKVKYGDTQTAFDFEVVSASFASGKTECLVSLYDASFTCDNGGSIPFTVTSGAAEASGFSGSGGSGVHFTLPAAMDFPYRAQGALNITEDAWTAAKSGDYAAVLRLTAAFR